MIKSFQYWQSRNLNVRDLRNCSNVNTSLVGLRNLYRILEHMDLYLALQAQDVSERIPKPGRRMSGYGFRLAASLRPQ
jgi:hypothetical protein